MKYLDAKIASSLKKIFQNTHFKKKVSLEEQKAQIEDRFLRGRQITFMIYDYFRVTGVHDTVLDYVDFFRLLFMMTIFRNSIKDGKNFFLSMTKFPSDDILENLHKLKMRESEQLKTVLELYDMEIHQKILMHNNQRLKNDGEEKYRSETSIANFDAGHEKIETGAAEKVTGN